MMRETMREREVGRVRNVEGVDSAVLRRMIRGIKLRPNPARKRDLWLDGGWIDGEDPGAAAAGAILPVVPPSLGGSAARIVPQGDA